MNLLNDPTVHQTAVALVVTLSACVGALGALITGKQYVKSFGAWGDRNRKVAKENLASVVESVVKAMPSTLVEGRTLMPGEIWSNFADCGSLRQVDPNRKIQAGNVVRAKKGIKEGANNISINGRPIKEGDVFLVGRRYNEKYFMTTDNFTVADDMVEIIA